MAGSVKRRHVFYVPGYDPRAPAYYHGVYRDEAAKQARVNGYALAVGSRRRISDIEHAWTVTSADCTTTYSFLRYDDLMRARWARSSLAVFAEICRYTWKLGSRGLFWNVLRTSWPVFVSMAYASALAVGVIVTATLAGAAGWYWSGWSMAVVAAGGVFAGLVALRGPLESRVNAFWLARILSFLADHGDQRVPEFDRRVEAFADRIGSVLVGDGHDEVLLVGHSVGTVLVVSVAARLAERMGTAMPPLSLLTLGHIIPLLGLQRRAQFYRHDLALVAHTPAIDWIDVSAAIDGVCFALLDPLELSGVAQPEPTRPKPKLVSARFIKLFTPQHYAALRGDVARAHFQYLLSAEIPGDYDYFLITAGDRRLADRFSHLASHKGLDRSGRSKAKATPS